MTEPRKKSDEAIDREAFVNALRHFIGLEPILSASHKTVERTTVGPKTFSRMLSELKARRLSASG